MGTCNRCGKEFAADELATPSAILGAISAPVLILLRARTRLMREASGLYCRHCRRQLNVCYLFIAFMLLVISYFYLLKWIDRNPLPPRRAPVPARQR